MYLRPESLQDALEIRASCTTKVLAGGTDICARPTWRTQSDAFLDITRIVELDSIYRSDGNIVIGALTSWSKVRSLPLFDGGLLAMTAASIGAPQIQNRGTIGGNICNASPVADGVTSLLALNAVVTLKSLRTERTLALREFLRNDGGIDLSSDELLTTISFTAVDSRRASFQKIALRRDLALSIVMCASVVDYCAADRIRACDIVVGAASIVPQDMPRTAASVVTSGGVVDERSLTADIADLKPISDIRGSVDYRRYAAAVAVKRSLADAFGKELADAR